MQKLTADFTVYRTNLRYDKEGTKENPVQLIGVSLSDPEAIGQYFIKLYQSWKPTEESKIGQLYGFDLCIRQQREAVEEKEGFSYRYYNTFYAERAESGIKYTCNNGHPNTDNPKLAARYFLNAIDRLDALKERHQHQLSDLEKNIPMVAALTVKPFEKESELLQMKGELAKLEREIAIKIQEAQMKQNGLLNTAKEGPKKEVRKPAQIINMIPKAVTPLQVAMAKVNGTVCNAQACYEPGPLAMPRTKRSNRMGL